MLLEALENYLLNCFDAIGLLLMIKVNRINQRRLEPPCQVMGMLAELAGYSCAAADHAASSSARTRSLFRPHLDVAVAKVQNSF